MRWALPHSTLAQLATPTKAARRIAPRNAASLKRQERNQLGSFLGAHADRSAIRARSLHKRSQRPQTLTEPSYKYRPPRLVDPQRRMQLRDERSKKLMRKSAGDFTGLLNNVAKRVLNVSRIRPSRHLMSTCARCRTDGIVSQQFP
jgi:hypothetical protein